MTEKFITVEFFVSQDIKSSGDVSWKHNSTWWELELQIPTPLTRSKYIPEAEREDANL